MNLKSTRDRILQTLLNHPRSTISDLATAVGINNISVRHHINGLLAEGLVTAEEERHGVGRPRLVYFLTEGGLEKFPSRYFRLTNRLLDQLKESLPSTTINHIFSEMAKGVAMDYALVVEKMTTEEKLNFLKKLLAEEGFVVEWEKNGEEYKIHEVTCPYYHIGQSHPEVCSVDQTLISTILSVPAQKINCVLRGDNHCTYIIPIKTKEKANE